MTMINALSRSPLYFSAHIPVSYRRKWVTHQDTYESRLKDLHENRKKEQLLDLREAMGLDLDFGYGITLRSVVQAIETYMIQVEQKNNKPKNILQKAFDTFPQPQDVDTVELLALLDIPNASETRTALTACLSVLGGNAEQGGLNILLITARNKEGEVIRAWSHWSVKDWRAALQKNQPSVASAQLAKKQLVLSEDDAIYAALRAEVDSAAAPLGLSG